MSESTVPCCCCYKRFKAQDPIIKNYLWRSTSMATVLLVTISWDVLNNGRTELNRSLNCRKQIQVCLSAPLCVAAQPPLVYWPLSQAKRGGKGIYHKICFGAGNLIGWIIDYCSPFYICSVSWGMHNWLTVSKQIETRGSLLKFIQGDCTTYKGTS